MTEKERGIQQTSSFVVFLTEHDLLSMFIDDANNIFIVSNALERLKSKYISINLYTLALAYILTYNFVVCITKAWVINLSTYTHAIGTVFGYVIVGTTLTLKDSMKKKRVEKFVKNS